MGVEPLTVVVHGAVSDLGRRVLHRELPAPRFALAFAEHGTADRADRLAAADVVIVDAEPLRREDFALMPRLRLVQRLGRGPHDISGEIAAAAEHGVPLAHNRSGFAAHATAEHTVMVTLALLRRFPQTDRYVRESRWSEHNIYDAATRGLAGTRIGLVGMGRIGRRTAELLQAFGARVRYWSRTRPVPEPGAGWESSLRDLLSGSDVVSLHVRASSPAEFRLGAEHFAAMPPGSYFVNTARGVLVDQDALRDALVRGHLAGAALDVFADEPPRDPVLTALDNVILTPHIAGRTREVAEMYYATACANVARLADGRPLDDLVRPAAEARR